MNSKEQKKDYIDKQFDFKGARRFDLPDRIKRVTGSGGGEAFLSIGS